MLRSLSSSLHQFKIMTRIWSRSFSNTVQIFRFETHTHTHNPKRYEFWSGIMQGIRMKYADYFTFNFLLSRGQTLALRRITGLQRLKHCCSCFFFLSFWLKISAFLINCFKVLCISWYTDDQIEWYFRRTNLFNPIKSISTKRLRRF